jgi:hypothetical protein
MSSIIIIGSPGRVDWLGTNSLYGGSHRRSINSPIGAWGAPLTDIKPDFECLENHTLPGEKGMKKRRTCGGRAPPVADLAKLSFNDDKKRPDYFVYEKPRMSDSRSVALELANPRRDEALAGIARISGGRKV